MPFISSGIGRYTVDLSVSRLHQVIEKLSREAFSGRIEGIVEYKGKSIVLAIELKGGKIIALEITFPETQEIIKGEKALYYLKDLLKSDLYGYVDVKELTASEVEMDIRYNTDALVDPSITDIILAADMQVEKAEEFVEKTKNIEGVAEIEVVKKETRIKLKKKVDEEEKEVPSTLKEFLQQSQWLDKPIIEPLKETTTWLRMTLINGKYLGRYTIKELLSTPHFKNNFLAIQSVFKNREIRVLLSNLEKPIILGAIIRVDDNIIDKKDIIIDLSEELEDKINAYEISPEEYGRFISLSTEEKGIPLSIAIRAWMRTAYNNIILPEKETQIILNNKQIYSSDAESLGEAIISIFKKCLQYSRKSLLGIAISGDEKIKIECKRGRALAICYNSKNTGVLCGKRALDYLGDLQKKRSFTIKIYEE